VRRPRGASKAPLAVAGILAAPLFFVALLAFSLKLDKPSHVFNNAGTAQVGDPTKGTVLTIYLVAFAVVAALVVVGGLAMLLRSRLATLVPAATGIVASILLLIPLGTWGAEHTARYPLGIDNLPQRSSGDIWLPGEWEHNAQITAHQIGLVTIGLALTAVVLSVLLEIRRRRGIAVPVLPPSVVDRDSGGAPQITGGVS